MRILGYALITLGFLGGAYFIVVQTEGVRLAPYLISAAVGVAGVVVVRIALRREATHEEILIANIEAVETNLRTILDKVGDLDDRKEEIDVYTIHDLIDETLPEHLDSVAQARMSIAHRYGLDAYADLMNPFAAGERYINRAWSASTDGYIEEVHEYLKLARTQFQEALGVLDRLRQAA
ncbi:MAG: hypothetical protein R3338_05985 [Thermoanaerobaculia bacterium]|nr:hypothetical protein [Thermoanaerobaculia bacterium]